MSNFPRNIRIISSDNVWGHGFPVGAIVTATREYVGGGAGAVDAYMLQGRERLAQLLTSSDYEELDATSSDPTARVKYLYSVELADGTKITSTQDREYAREIKSHLGGKKEGVIIMAYAPVKEIR